MIIIYNNIVNDFFKILYLNIMKRYILPVLIWVIIWFGFFLYHHPLIRGDIKADISGGYDVRWEVYYQVKSNTIDLTSSIDIVWDKLDFVIMYDPEKVVLDMGDVKYESTYPNIYKVTINGPINISKFNKIVSVSYKWDRNKINISDVTIYNGSDSKTLSITNIP